MRVKIAPSILAADQADLKTEVSRVEQAGADMIHVDVTDGHFAPNISLGPDTVRALRHITKLPLDIHLMIEEPSKFIDSFLEAGGDILTVHSEVIDEKTLSVLAKRVHTRGKQIGLALKPSTPIPSWFQSRMDNIDLLLVLSVNPGFPGQKFMPMVLPKVARYLELLGDKQTEIEVDGGVDNNNAAEIVKSGATILVAGASVFRRGDVKTAMNDIRDTVEGVSPREVHA